MSWFTNLISRLLHPYDNKVSDERNSLVPVHRTKRPKPNQDMKLLLNDPGTPNLVATVKGLVKPEVIPPFTTQGYVGPQSQMGTDAWLAAQTHYTIMNGFNAMQPAFAKPITRWPGTPNLIIMPKAGRDLNAYYDRRSLRFFWDIDKVANQAVFAAASVDVVAHELGHGLLDCVRPDLWNSQALEVWALHEGWSDLVAIFTLMKYEEVLKATLQETGGDLMKSSPITRLAEQLGTAIYHITKGRGGYKPGALRNANNSFLYQVPERLPATAPDDQLASECHSFGRVFLGAYYEAMTKIYEQERAGGCEAIEAMKRARNVGSKLLARAVAVAPATPRFFDAVARCVLNVDRGLGGKYQQALTEVFTRRRILIRKAVKAQSILKLTDLNPDEHISETHRNGDTSVRIKSQMNLKLSEHFGIKAQADNPLYRCEIEVPNESYLHFDKDGNLVDSIGTSERVAINSARECVKLLHANNMVDMNPPKENEQQKQFAVVDGKLVRNFFI